MTERPDPEFDENVPRPHPPTDPAGGAAQHEGSAPHHDSPSPAPDQPPAGFGASAQPAGHSRFDWPDRPTAGFPEGPTHPVDPSSGAHRAEPPPGSPPRPMWPVSASPDQRWPDRSPHPGTDPDEDVTSVVNLPNPPTWDNELQRRRSGAPSPLPPSAGPLDWRSAGERYGPPVGAPPGSQLQPYGTSYPQGDLPPAPGRPGESPGHPQWQPPAAQGDTETSEEAYSWSQAQGSGTKYNYVDNIRSSELVPSKRTPPTRGWRKALYRGSFKLINLGRSRDEREQDDLEKQIRSLLRGKYKIGVLGKGGVGKSTISASVGSVFAGLRKDDRVVAVDADTAFGKLASRIDPSTSGSYWELAADQHLDTFADIRGRLGSNEAGLYVLGGESATARRRVLDQAIYQAATFQLDRHFTLSIVDCGSTLDSPVTRAVLDDLDALIVVSSPWYDGASAAGQTLEWLANDGYTSLLNRTVVVLNDSDGHSPKRDRALLLERFSQGGHKVIELPYDEHLRPGGVIDLEGDINRDTHRALLKVAAACAEHFAATTDGPRGINDRHRR
ncbi:MinD/ParA family protein (plasmid) [Mycobacterium sp. Aquia_216]|uniref:nucleotide-binding protein n=1 Tax=Mycobacterium sp. Aquia_216 TaxID=2991729 RepID=UPI00227A833D|nr:MinD/ParA family protein [Mycobacterium sp. Aquia_216]WAJ48004.1 MinD/ParA family protein [Mycobacterium sp. Aquia_216]